MKSPHATFVATPLVLLVIFATLVAAGGTATADSEIEVGVPHSAQAGDIIEVIATVTGDAQESVSGITITASYFTRFGGVGGWVELARGVTDDNGTVVLSFEHRSFGDIELRVDRLDEDAKSVASTTVSIEDIPGGPQLYSSAVGISIPGLNASAVLLLVALTWGLLSYAALQLFRVSSEGDSSKPASNGEAGSISLGLLIVVLVPTVAITMLIVISRNPLTHANLSGAENYGRTDIAFLEVPVPYDGPGDIAVHDLPVSYEGPGEVAYSTTRESGQVLYFLAGCASCHGLSNQGGIAPSLVHDSESLKEFTRDVRKGPKAMPSYEPETLSDDQIHAIYDYLSATNIAP